MEMRELGKTGFSVTPLGFGAMRMPRKPAVEGSDNALGEVDEQASIELIRYAIDQGINYIDTAYNYMDGLSESILGKALTDGYREKVVLASKSPVWLFRQEGDFDRYLDEQLARLGMDHIDVYLLHSLNGGSWKKVLRTNTIPALLKAKEEGKVGAIGFSFHDDLDLFDEILEAAPWDVCQIQLNWNDDKYQAGIEGMRHAAKRNMGVIIMEPLRGGELVEVPARVQEVFDAASEKRSNAEWAFDYLWDLPEVSVVLSGMETPAIVDEDVAYMQKAQVGMLTPEQRALFPAAKKAFASYGIVPCTGCNYCVEYCPNHIVIPYCFRAKNLQLTAGMEAGLDYYNNKISGFGKDAADCEACGACEAMCPQHIPISELLPEIHEELFQSA